MSNGIQPFRRLSGVSDTAVRHRWLLGLMRSHLATAAVLLLLGALGLLWYMYTLQLRTITVDSSLRITRAGKIFEPGSQVKLLLVLLLAGASLIQFRAARCLRERRHGGASPVRLAVMVLLAGFPLAWVMRRTELDIPGAPAWSTDVMAAALVFQSVLALAYFVFLLTPAARRLFSIEKPAANSALRRIRQVGFAVWVLAIGGVAIMLGVATDWLYDLPVPRPEPGELLYATTFEAATDEREWDTYRGRDAAQLVSVDALGLAQDDNVPERLTGRALVITYGSPYTNEVVFSLLNRKFNDMDLRVTAQRVSGPEDNQYGVVFRYHDRKNYYGFFISSDGYYSLVKRQDGTLTDISAWGLSDAIRQGGAANEIRIVARGSSFQFFINGQAAPLCLRGTNDNSMWAEWEGPGVCFEGGELTYTYQDSSFEQGRVALAAGSSVDLSSDIEVAFDDLVILGPEAVLSNGSEP